MTRHPTTHKTRVLPVAMAALAIACSTVQRRFDTTSPIEIDVRRLRALPQAGCGRLEVTTRQRAVLVAGQRQDQELVYQLSYCADGRFPEER